MRERINLERLTKRQLEAVERLGIVQKTKYREHYWYLGTGRQVRDLTSNSEYYNYKEVSK